MLKSDDPAHLRKRATQLQEIARSVCDDRAAEALRDFVRELEAKAALLEDATADGERGQ
jgi:hypothetical protein